MLDRIPGHVLFGWKQGRAPQQFVEDRSRGHTADSKQEHNALFPASWSDQQIVDAFPKVLEDPRAEVKVVRNGRRELTATVDGVEIAVIYTLIDGKAYNVFGYPVSGPGVRPGKEY